MTDVALRGTAIEHNRAAETVRGTQHYSNQCNPEPHRKFVTIEFHLHGFRLRDWFLFRMIRTQLTENLNAPYLNFTYAETVSENRSADHSRS